MKKNTLGIIPFLNCEPFYALAGSLDWRRSASPPRALGRLAEEGLVDAAPLSLLDAERLSASYEPLGNFGIATRETSMSILLFSKRPMWELSSGVISVTEKTSTAVALLEVLLDEKFRVRPTLERREESHDGDEGRLVIGDDALRAAETGLEGFEHVTDLATVWWEWKQLPFVFARWMVKRSLPLKKKEGVERWLKESLAAGIKNIPSTASSRAEDLALPETKIIRYLKNFAYELGPEELHGMEEFLRSWKSLQGRAARVRMTTEIL